MKTIDSYVPITKAKNQMLDIIRDINSFDNTIIITKNGLPQAVMMSVDHYDALQETMAILADTETMSQLRESIKELQNGEQLLDIETL